MIAISKNQYLHKKGLKLEKLTIKSKPLNLKNQNKIKKTTTLNNKKNKKIFLLKEMYKNLKICIKIQKTLFWLINKGIVLQLKIF